MREQQMQWWILAGAIVAETIATSALKASNGFTKLIPSLVVVIGYACAFYGLSVTLRTIPVGVAYAVWSGVGIVLVALIGWFVYGQRLDMATLIGMAMIIAGVIVMNVFSKAAV
jgi:small multidrug resistance pump